MRLDRFITLNLVQPFRRALRPVAALDTWHFTPGTLPSPLSTPHFPVPILMYHSLSDDPEPGVAPYYRVNTSPPVFRQQMQFLADHGYGTLTLDQLVTMLRSPATGHSALPAPHSRLVVITFDDGFRNFYTEAFPVLQEHGFTATMFLPTAFVSEAALGHRRGEGSRVKAPFRNAHLEFLTWNEVRELHQAGIQIGSHTVSHPRLVELGWAEIKTELSDSKSEIEQRLGERITGFCYPYAFPQGNRLFARQFSALLGETGYTCCTTTEVGRVQPGDDPHRLKRLPANSLDDLALFAAKLDGNYDWLAGPQALVKKLKPRAGVRPSAFNLEPSTTFVRP